MLQWLEYECSRFLAVAAWEQSRVLVAAFVNGCCCPICAAATPSTVRVLRVFVLVLRTPSTRTLHRSTRTVVQYGLL